jgi:hypothetical protein
MERFDRHAESLGREATRTGSAVFIDEQKPSGGSAIFHGERMPEGSALNPMEVRLGASKPSSELAQFIPQLGEAGGPLGEGFAGQSLRGVEFRTIIAAELIEGEFIDSPSSHRQCECAIVLQIAARQHRVDSQQRDSVLPPSHQLADHGLQGIEQASVLTQFVMMVG